MQKISKYKYQISETFVLAYWFKEINSVLNKKEVKKQHILLKKVKN